MRTTPNGTPLRDLRIAHEGLRRLRDGDLQHLEALADRIQRDRDCDRRTARTVAALAHAEICLDNLDEQSARDVAPVLARWVAGVNEEADTP